MEFGTKLDNGGIVIAATKMPGLDMYVVLARYNGEFATWWVNVKTLTAECGHYNDNITEAAQDYANRCQIEHRA